MKTIKFLGILILLSAFLLSGCVVRTYQVAKDRVDQDLIGNRGYLKGNIPANAQNPERKMTRETHVVEIELPSFPKLKKKRTFKQPETQVQQEVGENYSGVSEVNEGESNVKLEKYTVQKNETLQKISQKLYGTTKKWINIFNANKDVLKAPDKIYPGQVINVPVYEAKTSAPQKLEPKENLK